METPEKKHRHHRKHKHKKHKKHRRNREANEAEDTEQEVELDQIEYNIPHMDVIGDEITLGGADDDQSAFILDEHCDGTIEVIEEQLVEIDDAIGTINIEEMVLENYGQDYGEELEVDVGGMDDENGEEIIEDAMEDEELVEEGESEEDDPEESNQESKAKLIKETKSKKQKDKKNDGDISSEEEAWLDALESGKLEEVDDELKKIRNPKLMTVRQRALLERKGELQNEEIIKEELVALPTGYKETVMTEEALKKKALKSERRREVAAQKREKEKKRTIDRLLLKRESKNKSTAANQSASSTSGTATSGPSSTPRVPCYSWKQTADGECRLTIPPVMEASILTPRTLPEPPKVINCSIQGCSNPKRYSCSKTHVPLCSLNCYRTNMRSLGLAA